MLLSCPLCSKPHFDNVDTLRTTLISAATSEISCPVCNESLMGLDKLTIHLFTHINRSAIKTTLNEIISEQVKETIEEQPAMILPNEKSIRCDICNFSFSDENILEMHQKLLHQTVEDKVTGIYSYHCHLCSKKFKMRGSLMVHLRVAHYGFGHNNETHDNSKESTNKLNEKCDETVKSNNTKQWSCDVCTKLFTTKYFLKKHKRLHTGEMPYYCAQCKKSFTFQQSYHKHMLYHSSEKPHVCSECGRAFKELSTLHNHERIHSGERPFACETCGKCFRQRVSYLVHRRIHTGVMPYKCTACEKTFRYKVSQRSHKCPINPPGLVIRTNVTETQTTNDLVDTNLSTIVFNAQGEIIGQNFTFDGKHVITYNNYDNKNGNDKDVGKENNNQTESFNDNTNPDFFSMVMSPTILPDVESLCLSNSPQNHEKDDQQLHTINEESLKELLYGQSIS